MFIVNLILKNLLESIIFFINSSIISFGLFFLFSKGNSVNSNIPLFLLCLNFGIILGLVIPLLSAAHRKMISKFESENAGFIYMNEFRASIPFFLPVIIFTLVVSKLFIGLLFDIKSLKDIMDIDQKIGFWASMIITLTFLAIEITPFFIHLLLKNKDQIILEQSKEISTKNEQLKQSYETQLKIVSSIQHELGNKLPIVKFSLSDLENHLLKLNEQGIIHLNDKIRHPFEDENPENIASIQSLLSTMDIELQNSVVIVQNMRAIVQTDNSNINRIPTIINDFFLDDLKFRQKRFPKNVHVQIDGENVALNIDQSQFRVLLDNIYENSIRHSFIDSTKEYILKLFISKNKDSVVLVFMNNGMPFNEGMTASKYTGLNEFHGETGNSGIGGYLIGQVVRNHNGTLSIDNRPEFENFNTFITIELPLQINDGSTDTKNPID